ncbi:MAG: YkgJ family cysteine cluster protein [Thermodesulfobacteriota bacterium]
MDRDEWESICTKCGRCCYEKVDLGGGEIVYTDEPCVHLDTETNLCKVYDRRHEVEPDCISLTEELVRSLGWLPEGCAYVEHVGFRDALTAVRRAANSKRKQRQCGRRR